ncbi:hypothetical protein ACS0TY_026309 [Phlomoides rotata]
MEVTWGKSPDDYNAPKRPRLARPGGRALCFVRELPGNVTALPSTFLINLLHFCNFFRGKRGKIVAVSVWECVVWLLWKWRNAKVFRAEELRVNKVMEEVKARLWSWLVVKDPRSRTFVFADWNAYPRLVMGG